MIVTDHIKEVFCGQTFTYRKWMAVVPTNNYLICEPGIGELGPLDGSELDELQRHGYPMHAAQGFEFPFNIISIQVSASFSLFKKFVLQWAKLRLKADVIGMTGLSLGGIATYEQWHEDVDELLDFVAPVCGKLSPDYASQMRSIPCSSWHGELDTTVSYETDRKFVEAYNAINEQKIDWNPLAGVAHNAWDTAYSVTPGKDKLLQWIIANFASKNKPSMGTTISISGDVDKVFVNGMAIDFGGNK